MSNLLLQVFDEGRLTDSQGKTVDFRNTVIIMTSNLGSDLLKQAAATATTAATNSDSGNSDNISDEGSVGGAAAADDEPGGVDSATSAALPPTTTTAAAARRSRQQVQDLATTIVHQHFSPEFVNRLDEIVVFNPLDGAAIARICSLQLARVGQLLRERGVALLVTSAAVAHLSRCGTDAAYGARPMKRLIQSALLNPLATCILEVSYSVSHPASWSICLSVCSLRSLASAPAPLSGA